MSKFEVEYSNERILPNSGMALAGAILERGGFRETLSRYWMEKLLLTLNGSQDETILSDKVWLDETCCSVITRDRKRNDKGNLLYGLSRNQR